MSSDNGGEKPPRRKPKVSCSTFIGAGESDPKARQRCVADGKWVNIPTPMLDAMGGRIAKYDRVIGSTRCWFREGS